MKKKTAGESIIQGLEEILMYEQGKISLRTHSAIRPKAPKKITGKK